jgi:LysR family transcriptional regulator, glycine cleavage system transcriptional activator
LNLPDSDSLRCFVAAARHGNFRKAAREVALSPAAFSDRIRRLEEQAGERLFVRTTRSCRLSKAGERALPHAKQAIEAARRAIEASSERAPFELMIGTRYELGISWIVPSLVALEEACPERRIHLYFGDNDAMIASLESGKADCIITSARLSHPGVETASLHEERYALVASPKLMKVSPLTGYRDASKHTLLDAHADLPLFRYFLDARPPREVWRFARVQRLGTIGAIALQAKAGAGVAVLPRYYVERDLERGTLVEPMPKAKIATDYFRMIWRSGHPRSDDLAQLASELERLPLR